MQFDSNPSRFWHDATRNLAVRAVQVYKNPGRNHHFLWAMHALSSLVIACTIDKAGLATLFSGCWADWGNSRTHRSIRVLIPLNVACMQIAAIRLPVRLVHVTDDD